MSEPQFTEQDWCRFLASLGEDPDRAGLVETPSRTAKAWKHWAAGYTQYPAECLKVFEDGGRGVQRTHRGTRDPCVQSLQAPSGSFLWSGHDRLTMQVANTLMTHLQPNPAPRAEFFVLAREA